MRKCRRQGESIGEGKHEQYQPGSLAAHCPGEVPCAGGERKNDDEEHHALAPHSARPMPATAPRG